MQAISRFVRYYNYPLTLYLVSRVVIFMALWLTKLYSVGATSWVRWDSIHYLNIVANGYTFGGSTAGGNTIAFYPLYPLFVKVLSLIVPGKTEHVAVGLSLFFGLAASLALYRYITLVKNSSVAKVGVTLFVFYPLSIFLSAPYSEGLFLLLMVVSLILLEQRRYLPSSITIGLAMVARPAGLLLLPILLYYFCRDRDKIDIKQLVVMLVMSLLPLFMFLYYQGFIFGTPLAFLEAQDLGWGKTTAWPWTGLSSIIDRLPRVYWRFELAFLISMVLTLWFARRSVRPELLFFSWVLIVFTLSSDFIVGFGRYLMAVLPFYIYWGDILVTRPAIRQLIYYVLIAWMTINAQLFFLSKPII